MDSHFMKFRIFKEVFQGPKLIGLKRPLYHWKFWNVMSKMSLHDPFEYLKHKLWPKKRVKNQIVNLTFDH
jgi:hypothetical protein